MSKYELKCTFLSDVDKEYSGNDAEKLLTKCITLLYGAKSDAGQQMRYDLINVRGTMQNQRAAVKHLRDKITGQLKESIEMVESQFSDEQI